MKKRVIKKREKIFKSTKSRRYVCDSMLIEMYDFCFTAPLRRFLQPARMNLSLDRRMYSSLSGLQASSPSCLFATMPLGRGAAAASGIAAGTAFCASPSSTPRPTEPSLLATPVVGVPKAAASTAHRNDGKKGRQENSGKAEILSFSDSGQ